jgi:DoxX-like family
MSTRTLNITYWTLTVLFCALLLLSSSGGFLQTDETRQMMALLGYPMQLLVIISIGKVLAVIALVQQRYVAIKEWAYAGLFYDFVCAAIAWEVAGNRANAFSLAIPLTLMTAHYVLWKLRLRRAAR